jgi:hypothetical protein
VSEFSDSFHLRTNDSADAIALLRAAGVPGSVFPAKTGWVSFVFERGMRVGTNELADRVFAANKGLLVDYAYAADHGCWVSVYRGPERVARLRVSFETPSRSFDREALLQLGLLTPAGADAIDGWMREEQRSREYVVAEQLGLPRYRWFARRYEVEEPSEGGVEVDADGRVRSQKEALEDEIEELLRTLPPTRKRLGAITPPTKGAEQALAKKPVTKKRVTKKPATKRRAQRG